MTAKQAAIFLGIFGGKTAFALNKKRATLALDLGDLLTSGCSQEAVDLAWENWELLRRRRPTRALAQTNPPVGDTSTGTSNSAPTRVKRGYTRI